MKINYVTGNELKVKLACKVFNSLGIEVVQKNIETPEIQSMDCKEVAEYSAVYAANLLNVPVLKNDSGFCIEELNNFPGALAKYAESSLGAEGIIKLLEGKENRNCYWVEVLSYCEPGKDPVSFTSYTYGTISDKIVLGRGYEYDKIFKPLNDDRTFSTMSEQEQIDYFDTDAYVKLAEYLKNKKA